MPGKKRASGSKDTEESSQGTSRKEAKVVHNTKKAYVTFIWGLHVTHILECLFLGMQLKRVSPVQRICFIAEGEVPLQGILSLYWEIRHFNHLELESQHNNLGTSGRLSKVYSKLQLWNLDRREIEVAVLLDTDLLVTQPLDEVFCMLERAELAGVFRGNANFALDKPRPPNSIKTEEHRWGGGINGGVLVVKPDKWIYAEMLKSLKNYRGPPGGGGEQDFLSKFFGRERKTLAQLDVVWNGD